MAEETSATVKKTSDGQVRITVEKYHELLEKAATKPPIVHNVTQKTAAMVAADNKMWGVVFIGGGTTLVLLGSWLYATGKRQSKALKLVRNR